jgi:hypothetical protein
MDDTIQLKYADLIGWGLIVLCSLASIAVILSHLNERRTATTRTCWAFVEPAVSAFLSTLATFFIGCFMTIFNTLFALLKALQSLPKSWYAMITLTILPVFTQIAQSFVIAYLAFYCAIGLYICASTPIPKKPTPIAAGAQKLKTHLFSELRITSVH